MSYLNVFLIASAASIPLLLASPNAYSQENWSGFLDINRENDAQVYAKTKLQKHSVVSEDKIRDVESYVRNNCPELNPDIIQYGLSSFLRKNEKNGKKEAPRPSRKLRTRKKVPEHSEPFISMDLKLAKNGINSYLKPWKAMMFSPFNSKLEKS
ncbi:MAG: hypothetical protein K2W92_09915 [Alphaproteobacteria bacterium]|nr:hypothetical protein [Alphaproteobacteria bacterium]